MFCSLEVNILVGLIMMSINNTKPNGENYNINSMGVIGYTAFR